MDLIYPSDVNSIWVSRSNPWTNMLSTSKGVVIWGWINIGWSNSPIKLQKTCLLDLHCDASQGNDMGNQCFAISNSCHMIRYFFKFNQEMYQDSLMDLTWQIQASFIMVVWMSPNPGLCLPSDLPSQPFHSMVVLTVFSSFIQSTRYTAMHLW